MKMKCYEYEWYDHSQSSGWMTSFDRQPYVVHSVGYLVDEDDKHLYFTEGLVPTTQQYHGIMTILKSALKRKKLIFTKEIA